MTLGSTRRRILLGADESMVGRRGRVFLATPETPRDWHGRERLASPVQKPEREKTRERKSPQLAKLSHSPLGIGSEMCGHMSPWDPGRNCGAWPQIANLCILYGLRPAQRTAPRGHVLPSLVVVDPLATAVDTLYINRTTPTRGLGCPRAAQQKCLVCWSQAPDTLRRRESDLARAVDGLRSVGAIVQCGKPVMA